jgi:hypothetical protein
VVQEFLKLDQLILPGRDEPPDAAAYT